MKVKRLILGSMQTNGYVISNDDKQCLLIDPGDIGKKIVNYVEENELTIIAILLTHGHSDHIGAVDYLYERYHCPIYMHTEDMAFLKDSKLNLSSFWQAFTVSAPVLEAPDRIELAGFTITWLHLPGHTPGSSMLYFKKEKILFSGDVLFKGSIGRYDFPLSSHHDTKETIAKIKEYDFDAIVYPGHGETTTLQEEQMHNPFFQ